MNILKKALSFSVFEEIYLNDMLEMPLPIFANAECLSNLTCAIYKQSLLATLLMKTIKFLVNLSIYHNIES